MKRFLFIIAAALIVYSCGTSRKASKVYLDSFVAEEVGLNIQKITDESKGSVIGNAMIGSAPRAFVSSGIAGCKKSGMFWSTSRLLSISPEGTELAYLTIANKQKNVMVRRTTGGGNGTQRTFRNVLDFSYGPDGYIYFSDQVGADRCQIHSINAKAGSIMRQLTSNSEDINPILANNKKNLFFTRYDNSGPVIWCLDIVTGTLTSCARGYDPYPVGDGDSEFLCVRNSAEGVSEIWLVNYISGIETLLLTEKERGFSNPSLSPDGNWVLVEGSSISSTGKVKNLDVFAVKIDGTSFVQLTYHPGNDCCPMWSQDGKSVYFISSRANKDKSFNVWKMNFNL